MIWTFFLGIFAGLGASQIDMHLKNLIEKYGPPGTVGAPELRATSVVIALFVAAIIGAILGGGGGIILTFGALIGVFGPTLLDLARTKRTPDYDT